jgi:hypothetical protein
VAERQRTRFGIAIIVAVPLLAALASEFPLCPSAGVFGVPCPGCGLTRATLAALKGDFAAAFQLHPLVFVIAPVYLAFVGHSLWRYLKGPAVQNAYRPPSRWLSAAALALLVAMMGVWGARFFDALGGPVEVRTYAKWAQAHALD